jgi:TolA-binding protein
MTGPKRLIEEGDAFDRALLRAHRAERPSANYERRVIATAAAASTLIATDVARQSIFARVASSTSIRFLAVAAIGIGAAVFSVSRSESPAPAPTTVAATTAAPKPMPSNDEPPAPVASPAEVVTVTPDSLPSAPPAPVATAAAPALPKAAVTAAATEPAQAPTPAPVAATGASLQREVELLDTVKRSLRSGASVDAKTALDAYDAEFPQGTLKPEAGFLRIRLHLANGDRAAAVALGDELLRRHPDSVHASRIRAALAADSGDKSR